MANHPESATLGDVIGLLVMLGFIFLSIVLAFIWGLILPVIGILYVIGYLT